MFLYIAVYISVLINMAFFNSLLIAAHVFTRVYIVVYGCTCDSEYIVST